MIKLVACDLDGTLFDDTHQLPFENVNAIQEAMEQGVTFMVATGRNYKSVAPYFQRHKIHCSCLLLNGALICDPDGNTIFELLMKQDATRAVMKLLEREGLCFHVYAHDGLITTNGARGVIEFKKHMASRGMSEEEIEELMETSTFGQYDREVESVDAYLKEEPRVYKIETFGSNSQKLAEVREKLMEIQGVAVTNSVADNIEVTDLYAQKGYSLHKFCEANNLNPKEIAVIGDSLNDLSMMELFENSIAVANATPQILKAANYRTLRNTEFGVAHALRRIIAENAGGEKAFHISQNKVK